MELKVDKMTENNPKNSDNANETGNVLYNLLTGQYHIADFANDTYQAWQTEPPKQKLKDLIFIISIVGFWGFMIWVIQSEYMVGIPSIRYPDGTVVTGNCSFIWEEYRSRVQGTKLPSINLSRVLDDPNYAMSDGTTTPVCKPCPTTTTLACPICPACPKFKCPDCSPCVCEKCLKPKNCVSEEEVLDTINRVRPSAESPAYQNGFYDMRKICQGALGGNVSRFREGPGHINWRWLSGIEKEPEPTFTFYHDEQYCFGLNHTLWGWNNDDCRSSYMTVCRL